MSMFFVQFFYKFVPFFRQFLIKKCINRINVQCLWNLPVFYQWQIKYNWFVTNPSNYSVQVIHFTVGHFYSNINNIKFFDGFKIKNIFYTSFLQAVGLVHPYFKYSRKLFWILIIINCLFENLSIQENDFLL